MDNYIGKLLDNRYEILEVIGTGGMAVVYKALCHRLNRLVAVKILKDEFSRDQEFRRRFHAESQAVAMLSHPNIVSVYDVSRSDDADYIVMELIEGITLKQYLEKKGALNWRETLHFSIQIAKALEHAHSRGIVHRDIKPHNIMILRDGSIKVADFGIARIVSAQNTLTREALGSVHYISPEQAKGARVDARSDLYSLGVVMYEMLTGRTPYDGETPVSVAIQHISGGAPLPSSFVDGIPRGLEQITLHAMTANVDLRYGSAAEMLHDMEEFRKDPEITFTFDGEGGTSVVHVPQASPEERSAAPDGLTPEQRRAARVERERREQSDRRRGVLTWVIIVAALLLVATVVTIVLVLRTGDGNTPSTSENTSSSKNVIVPNLLGKQLSEINPSAFPELIIDVDGATFEYSEIYEKGQIMDQSPQPGEEVRGGKSRTVRLTVSLGRQMNQMPDLVGQTESAARAQLTAMNYGLQIRVVEEGSDTVPIGNVVRTEPESGSELSRGQRVLVYVSLGPTTLPVLKGETLENAKELLNEMIKNLNLIVKYLEEQSEDVPAGCVTRTDPLPGSTMGKSQRLTVYVSSGDGKIEVPQVLGFDMMNAITLLRDAGLRYSINEVYSDTVEAGKVVSQSEAPNARVEKDTIVVLEISKGPAPSPMPTDPEQPTLPSESATPARSPARRGIGQ